MTDGARFVSPGPNAQLLEKPAYRASFDDYLRRCDPMYVATFIETPLLVVNAMDDPICVESNIPRDAGADALVAGGSKILAVTARGRYICTAARVECGSSGGGGGGGLMV